MKLEIKGSILNIVNAYAPQVNNSMEEKIDFWQDLDGLIESVSKQERIVLDADLNELVGEGNIGDEEIMWRYGAGTRNKVGSMVVDFAKRTDLVVVNTYFKKKDEHRVTYKSGRKSTQVDYVMWRRRNLKEMCDYKLIVNECVAKQHRMVVCKMALMMKKKNNNNNIYLFAKRTNINFIIHTHGNVKENRNMCEGRGHRRTYVIKSSAPTSSTVKNKIYIYIN